MEIYSSSLLSKELPQLVLESEYKHKVEPEEHYHNFTDEQLHFHHRFMEFLLQLLLERYLLVRFNPRTPYKQFRKNVCLLMSWNLHDLLSFAQHRSVPKKERKVSVLLPLTSKDFRKMVRDHKKLFSDCIPPNLGLRKEALQVAPLYSYEVLYYIREMSWTK